MSLKKIFLILLGLVPFWSVFAESAPYDFQTETSNSVVIDGQTFINIGEVGNKEINTAKLAREEMIQAPDSLLTRLIVAFNLAPFRTADSGTFYLRVVINYALALVALIATVSLIMGFYRMFVSDNGTEAFARALKLVKGSIIAIFLLGFSWTIISFLLNVFFKISLFPTTT